LSGILDLGLIHVTLTQAVAFKFEAISYTWGAEGRSKDILLEGGRYTVTPNVHRLLHARGSMVRDRYLWIDSTCINQNDLAEKTEQLKVMADIYSNAHRVVSWFGDPYDAPLAVDFIRNHKAYMFDTSGSSAGQANYIGWKAQYWQSFFEVVCWNPYFSRVWMCQECILGRVVHFYLGGTYISYPEMQKTIIDATTTWQTVKAVNAKRGIPEAVVLESLPLMSLRESADYQSGNGTVEANFKLGALLSLSCRCKCGKPVGKVYGMLGMATSEMMTELDPDYTKPVADVYTQVAGILLDQGEADYVLPHAGICVDGRMAGLPSWAPDWFNERTQMRLGLRAHPSDDMFAPSLRATPVSSTLGQPRPLFTFNRLTNRLFTRTIRTDTITHISDPLHFNTNLPSWRDRGNLDPSSARRKQEIQDMLRFFSIRGDTSDDALWRTLVANRNTVRRIPSANYRVCFKLWTEMDEGEPSISDDEARLVMDALEMENPELDGEARRQLAALAGAIEFHSRVAEVALARRPCVTSEERIGWVPEKAKTGDVVFVFPGLQSPYVMREVGGDGFQLVGECYIHG
jgi:hypothetical protein